MFLGILNCKVNRPEEQKIDQTESRFSHTKILMPLLNTAKMTLDMTAETTHETAEATIRRTLGSYDIGRKIKHLRLRKKIALTDLGKHTGLSASMLSQLENGKLIPTLPTPSWLR